MINPCVQKPLPVTLLSFSAERKDEANVTLLWQTSEEVNNDYFQVERTVNSSAGFQIVGSVKGTDSSKSTVKYQITDVNKNSGYTYYRLKQVDLNGTYEYSSIVAVKGSKMPFSVAAFPNPSQAKTLLFKVGGLKAPEQLQIVIYDLSGKAIYQNDNQTASSDEQNLNLNLPGLSPGKYSIKVEVSRIWLLTPLLLSPDAANCQNTKKAGALSRLFSLSLLMSPEKLRDNHFYGI